MVLTGINHRKDCTKCQFCTHRTCESSQNDPILKRKRFPAHHEGLKLVQPTVVFYYSLVWRTLLDIASVLKLFRSINNLDYVVQHLH